MARDFGRGAGRHGARVSTGRAFFKGSTGKWAGEQMIAAVNAGQQISPAVLRANGVLRRDEWVHYDAAVISEALIRLVGVQDLIGAGLTIDVPNSMGKTVFSYEMATMWDEAQVSMDPVTRTENDRIEFDLGNLPLPVTHKDFYLNLRTLMASRERGEPLDTLQSRMAGRVVAEKTEQMLFQGLAGKFGGMSIYGLTNHPDRNTISFGTNGNWANSNTAKTGDNILSDIQNMISALEADRMNGPYWLYVPRNSSIKLDNDFKANSDNTIRQRLMMINGLQKIETADQLPANNVVMFQASSDVVAMIMGEPLQTVQWDVEGGFRINFKAFQIAIPLVRADITGRSGVVHMT